MDENPSTEPLIRIQTVTKHIDPKLQYGMKFGVLQDASGVLHCNADATFPKFQASHRRLVRLLMHQLFQQDTPNSDEIPAEAMEFYKQYYIGAGSLTVSTLKRCADRAYGQLDPHFYSDSCTESFGFSEPKNAETKLILIRGLILWGREHLIPHLDLDQDLMDQHADKRIEFEEAMMQPPTS